MRKHLKGIQYPTRYLRYGMAALVASLLSVVVAAQTEDPGTSLDPGTAVGTTSLSWLTSSTHPWAVNVAVYDAGAESLSSASIGDNQTSWLETSVTGPGRVVFRWALSSESSYDLLRFSVNDAVQSEPNGFIPWEEVTYAIAEAGEQKLRWTYIKDESVSVGLDRAYLDQVLWIPDGQGGLSVRLEGNGSGTVAATDAGTSIDCGPRCVASYALSTLVTLEATADTGSSFVGWSGACSGTQSTCQVSISQYHQVGAKFSTSSLEEALVDGEVRSGISGRALSTRSFYVDVPSGARDLVIRLDTATNTADNSAFMQVALGRVPSLSDYDCFPSVTLARQVCAFATPQAGRYYISVGGQSEVFSGIDLAVDYQTNASQHTITLTPSTGGRLVSVNVDLPVTTVAESIYQPQVIGGGGTAIEQWPWQVQVRAGGAFCSGTLIDALWVVTAAHCLDYGNSATIALGRTSLNSGGITRGSAEVIVHEAYTGTDYDHDIALVRLDSPVSLGPSIQVLALLSSAQESNLAKDGVLGTVTGWGLTREMSQPNTLQRADVAMISTQTCRNSGYSAESITDNMICAGFVDGGVDSCSGDSGGPLVVRDAIGGHRLAGITSWGNECAKPDYPGVYTRVSAFIDWIAENTGLGFTDTILDCGDRCQVTVPDGTQLDLVPEPDPGYFFIGFDGVCAGLMTCPLTVSGNLSIQGQFLRQSIFQDQFEAQ